MDLTNIRHDLSLVTVSFTRIWKFLDNASSSSSSSISRPKTSLRLENIQGEIEIRDVWFRYPEVDSEGWQLKGLDAKFPSKSRIAVVGRNGSAKSTLAYLLCGFLSPSRGSIHLDGVSMGTNNDFGFFGFFFSKIFL
jgi:ABC-type bacteriocin/lantibiotic exporter with double-glycine peptidase domain